MPFIVFLILVSDIKESQNISSLHKQISACDTILEVNRRRCMRYWYLSHEPHRDKACLRDFRQSEIQTSLLSYRD